MLSEFHLKFSEMQPTGTKKGFNKELKRKETRTHKWTKVKDHQ